MKNKKVRTRKNIITRLVIDLILFIVVVIGIFFIPKNIIDTNLVYQKIVENVDVQNQENLLLYSYEVYATEKKYQTGLDEDINFMRNKFKKEDRILLVRIPGDEYKVTKYEDYILIEDKEAYPLNIEYYVVKNIEVLNHSFPTETGISYVKNLSIKINKIAYIVLISVDSLFIAIFLLRSGINTKRLINIID